MSEEDLSSVFCLPNGEQLYLHSNTPSVGDWPVTLSQVFLLQDAQILMSNGVVQVLKDLEYDATQAEAEDCSTDLETSSDSPQPSQSNNNLETNEKISPDVLATNVELPPHLTGSLGLCDIPSSITSDVNNASIEEEVNDGDSNEIENSKEDELSFLVDVITTFKCRKCSVSASSRPELLDHIAEKHATIKEEVTEKLVFLCAQCAEAFDSLESCRTHMLVDHRLIREEDDITVRARRTPRLPKSLGEDFHLGKPNKSDMKLSCVTVGCKAKFSSEKDLDIHDLCHNIDNHDFKCCECAKQFDNWKPCCIHLWRAHQIDVGMLSCTMCDHKASTQTKLTNHMKIHSDNRDFKCTTCGKMFKQLSQLRNHSTIHLSKNSQSPRWYTAKQCHICQRTLADSKCLKKHLAAVHGGIRPYTCPVCGHTSARKAMMQLHLRQHSGEKPHACDVCDFKTGDHNSLRRHKMRHSGTKKYKCPHCSYAAIQSNCFKNHLRNKHPEKDGVVFECNLCPYRCVSEKAFVSHLGDHKREEKARESQQAQQELFPGNLAAAHLIFRCLNDVRANIASQSTSADGSEQTITIKIPTESNEVDDGCIRVEDLVAQKHVDEPDLGGITIPADPPPS